MRRLYRLPDYIYVGLLIGLVGGLLGWIAVFPVMLVFDLIVYVLDDSLPLFPLTWWEMTVQTRLPLIILWLGFAGWGVLLSIFSWFGIRIRTRRPNGNDERSS